MTVSARDKLLRYALAAVAFLVAAVGFALLPAHACELNQCPAPPPQHNCHCQPPTVIVPSPNVPPPNIVVVNAGARAQAQAGAQAFAIAIAPPATTIVRGGGGFVGGGGAVAVTGAAMSVTDESMAASSRMRERMALIQAICIDDTNSPHPASQTFADRNVPGDYSGEIFRCMSGTHMRVTIEGRSFDCTGGQALWYDSRTVTCRAQAERRPCNERSLLRRFGPGDKMALIRETEAHQERRETRYSGQMTMDGGVGQSVW